MCLRQIVRFAGETMSDPAACPSRQVLEEVRGDGAALAEVQRLIHRSADEAFVLYDNKRLTSAFQPIVSFAHQQVVGHEALLRAWDARRHVAVAPLQVFDAVRDDAEVVYLDRLCRALHVRNAVLRRLQGGWLFLNINPDVIIRGRDFGPFFADLLNRHRVGPHQVVIEVVESSIANEGQLAEAVRFFKDLGCLVALDDFGSGHSNFERVWRVSPDIVKLDRSFTTQIMVDPRARQVLPGLVGLLHEAGSLVLMEGIETEAQALAAMDCDVDFGQGYFFGRPSPNGRGHVLGPEFFDRLDSAFGEMITSQKTAHQSSLPEYVGALERAATKVVGGSSLPEACAHLLELSDVERCFVLDAEGVQIGANLEARRGGASPDARFDPLADMSRANWSRRPYFRRALCQPGKVQVTRPYLSVRDARYCVTLSLALEVQGQRRVLCADLRWDSSSSCAGICCQ